MSKLTAGLADWFDHRTGFRSLRRQAFDEPLPPGTGWWFTLGSLLLFGLAVQVVTGIALAMFYAPTPDHAYDSIRFIISTGPGRIVRGLHHYGSSFLVVAVVVGRYLAPKLFEVIVRMRVRYVLLVASIAFALTLAALAGIAGSALIIGAFAAGLILSETNHFDLITKNIHPLSDIFAPIFFVYVGSSVNVALLNPASDEFVPSTLVLAGALLVVAIIGKLASGFVVGWKGERLNHMMIGVGMVPRGEVGLIFAHLGLDNNVIDATTFNALIIVVMLTTFVAPPLLKSLSKKTPAALEEAA